MPILRMAVVLIVVAMTGPALAQQWTTYHNARYGVTADIPPEFAPSGPEAANSDGLIFRASNGLLTVYGAPLGGSFEAFVEAQIEHDQTYGGWPVSGHTITPDWAEYWGGVGGGSLKVRIEAACNGKIAIIAKFEMHGRMPSSADRVFASLHQENGRAC
ncbi:MAG: hypothetical protein H6873_04645 [Hyphomicrobiaceae bacterium]|nr:hypothetical protein [Hyphomicrobiaceae bacterium]